MARSRPRDWVALILAVGLVTAMNTFTLAVLWDAVTSQESGLSENATQVLTGWGGGIIGILGAVFGARLAGPSGTPPEPGEDDA